MDSAYPEVAVAEEDAVVCSLVAPAAGGEELAWCEIRRGGDASSATIRNLRYDTWLVLSVAGNLVERALWGKCGFWCGFKVLFWYGRYTIVAFFVLVQGDCCRMSKLDVPGLSVGG